MPIESNLEQEARTSRDGALVLGLGATAIGSEVSPRLLLVGLVMLIGAAAYEGIRHLVHNPNPSPGESTQIH